MLTRKQLLYFVTIFLLAASVRFAGITFDSLWLDESYQSLVGAYGQGVPDLLSARQHPYRFQFGKPAETNAVLANFRKVDPLCPPLYAVSLNAWIKQFGDSDLAIRSLSAVVSCLSVVALFVLVLSLFGAQIALVAALVQALSPFDVHYAQEARMYSMVVLFSILSFAFLTGILKQTVDWRRWSPVKAASRPPLSGPPDSRDLGEGTDGVHYSGTESGGMVGCKIAKRPVVENRATFGRYRTGTVAALTFAYAASAWALVNSHYTGLFVLLFQIALSACWILATRQWSLFFWLSPAFLLTAIFSLPWLPLFLQSAGYRKESFYVTRAATFWWPFYALFFKIPVNWESFLSGTRVGGYAIPVYVTAALSMVSAAVAGCRVVFEALVADYGLSSSRVARPSVEGRYPASSYSVENQSTALNKADMVQVAGVVVTHSVHEPAQVRCLEAEAPGTVVSSTSATAIKAKERGDCSVSAPVGDCSAPLAASGLKGFPGLLACLERPGWSMEKSFFLSVWMWALLPAAGIWVMDVLEGRKVVEIARYTIGTAPAVYILAGVGFALIAKRFRRGWLLLAFHSLFCIANLYYLHNVHQREPWREMAATVEKICKSDDLLVVSEYYNIACLDRYLSRPYLQLGGSPAMGASYVQKMVAGRQRFILITAQEGEFIKDLLPAEFRCMQHIDLRHGVHLRVYERRPQ